MSGTEVEHGWDDTTGALLDVRYVKTQRGLAVLRDRSVNMSACQRALFIMVDGRHTLEQLLLATIHTGATLDDVDLLLAHGLIEDPTPELTARAERHGTQRAAQPPPPPPPPSRSAQQRFLAAYPIASKITADLGFRGIRLHLAVESASTYEDLVALAPKIKAAVAPERYAVLRAALRDER